MRIKRNKVGDWGFGIGEPWHLRVRTARSQVCKAFPVAPVDLPDLIFHTQLAIYNDDGPSGGPGILVNE